MLDITVPAYEAGARLMETEGLSDRRTDAS